MSSGPCQTTQISNPNKLLLRNKKGEWISVCEDSLVLFSNYELWSSLSFRLESAFQEAEDEVGDDGH